MQLVRWEKRRVVAVVEEAVATVAMVTAVVIVTVGVDWGVVHNEVVVGVIQAATQHLQHVTHSLR